MTDRVRVDVWLWAIRVFKTRTAATDACRQGAVRVNDVVAKPARTIEVGDAVSLRRRGHTHAFAVEGVSTRRVGAAAAAELFTDHNPAPPRTRNTLNDAVVGNRDPGSGRPTKRDRRDLDRLRGRNTRRDD